MTGTARKVYRFVRRVKALRRAISPASAFRLALAENRRPVADVLLTGLNQSIRLRTMTSDVHCFEKVFLYREYDVPFAIEPTLIVDAGANIGMASLFFRERYPQARIVAVEPESSNFELLTYNCRGLRMLSAYQAAIWPEKCELKIRDSGAEKWAFSVTSTEGGAPAEAAVRALTIPDLMSTEGIDRIDLLKLDIETAEKELFSRNTDTWLPRVDLIIIELHDRMLPGCAKKFYEAIRKYDYVQEVRGENIFIKLP